MRVSVQFYRDILGMELIYGGEDSYFSSLRVRDVESAILNFEKGDPGKHWGRLILYVTDVDAFWTHLKERGFDPARHKMVLDRTRLKLAAEGFSEVRQQVVIGRNTVLFLKHGGSAACRRDARFLFCVSELWPQSLPLQA
jgi:hypothetical protein